MRENGSTRSGKVNVEESDGGSQPQPRTDPDPAQPRHAMFALQLWNTPTVPERLPLHLSGVGAQRRCGGGQRLCRVHTLHRVYSTVLTVHCRVHYWATHIVRVE